MVIDEQRLESLTIEWIIQQVRARRRMKDTLPIEGAMTVPLEWAESLANVYAGMPPADAPPPVRPTAEARRWERYEECLRYLHEHPAEPMGANETRPPGFFEGWQTAVSMIWFQFELMSRGEGFPESDSVMGPVVSKATGYPPRPDYGELAQAIRDIADRDAEPLAYKEKAVTARQWECVYCYARGESAGKVNHAVDCLWLQAVQLAARLPPEGTQ